MIDTNLPSWPEILRGIGEPAPRRGRARCPIHNGDSRNSLSVSEDKGFFCHVCHAGGDKIAFVEAVLHTNFKDALRWLGIEPGQPPKPDAAVQRRNTAMETVREWCKTNGRRLRGEYLHRERITAHGQERLAADPEDETAWELLRIACDGKDRNEFLLDEIDLCRNDDERLAAWRKYRWLN